MHVADAISSSLQSIFNHKLRSLLTLIGIVIGVMAVVTMFSSVYALKALIKKNMEGMGWNNSIIITPGGTESKQNLRRQLFRRNQQSGQTLDFSDYEALKTQTDHKSIYGMIESSSIYRLGNKDVQVRLRATDEAFFENKSYKLLSGRYFNNYENQNRLPVAVLGYYFAEEQFGTKDPLGQAITLGKQPYRVVGVLNKDELNSGNGMNFNNWERMDDLKAVYVPLTYGAQYLSPNKGIHYIYLQSKTEFDFAALKTRARQILLSRHNMYPVFSFMDVGDFLLQINKEIDSTMKKWNITLSAIASISLIVGGIGLFSTLLISIQERMTEIGIRKSLGARDGDIFLYFIFEALTLAFTGAMLGIFVSWLAILGMEKAIKMPLYLPIQGIALGTAFSLLIGFLSGLYPALKAANIDPIKAIYYFE